MTRKLTREQKDRQNQRARELRAGAPKIVQTSSPDRVAALNRASCARRRARKKEAEAQERAVKFGYLTLLPPLGPWTAQATCAAPDIPTEWFWPPKDRPDVDPEDLLKQQRAVARICGSCPVRQDCHDEAVKNRFPGTWGGVLFFENGSRVDLVKQYRRNDLNSPIRATQGDAAA